MRELKTILILIFCIGFDYQVFSNSLQKKDSCNIEFTTTIFFEVFNYSFKLNIADTSNITVLGEQNCFVIKQKGLIYNVVFCGPPNGGIAIISVYRNEGNRKKKIYSKEIKFESLVITGKISGEFYSGSYISKKQLKNSAIFATIINYGFGYYFQVKSFMMTIEKENNVVDITSFSEKFTDEQMRYINELDEGKPVIIRNIVIERNATSKEKMMIDPIIFFIKRDL